MSRSLIFKPGGGGSSISGLTADRLTTALDATHIETPSTVETDQNLTLSIGTFKISGGTLLLCDNPVAITKYMAFDVSALANGAVFLLKSGAQTAAFTLTCPVLVANDTIMSLGTAQAITGAKTILDSFKVVGTSDPTKGLRFEPDAQTTGKTLTFDTGAQTVDRTLTVPVLAGNRTLALIDQAQTFTAAQTFSAKLTTAASATGAAGLNLPHGAAPTVPVDGDAWTTTAGLYARINGATVGPFGTGGSGLSGLTTGRLIDAASSTTAQTSATITTDQALRLSSLTASRVTALDSNKEITTPATVTTAQAWAFTSTLSVVDGNFTITGSSDATKKIKFEADALTAAKTLTLHAGAQTLDRALTVPVMGGDRTMGVVGVNSIDWLNPVSITGTTTVTSSGVWKLHICTGTSADYAVTLPDSGMTVGDLIAFQMGTPSTLTRLVTLDATSGNLIDGVQTRIMWAYEVCVLRWDGTNWTKIAGKSIPMACCMKRTTTQSIATVTWTQIACTTVVYDNTSSLAVPFGDTTNGRARTLRPGKYSATGFASLSGVTAAVETDGGVARNSALPGDDPNAFSTVPVPSSGNVAFSGAAIFDCAAGDWIGPVVFHGDAASRNTRAVGTVMPSLSVTEIITW